MAYEAKNFDNLIGTQGFSEQLLKNHFTLYQGYVKNTNLLLETLKKMVDEDKASGPIFGELKRRLGFEFNGMRLHEYYFGNMSKDTKEWPKESAFAKAAESQFGSAEKFEKDFKASGTLRGVGWAITFYDPKEKTLMNAWVDEHHVNNFAGCAPILVMDCWEHAFMIDYGIKRPDYIEAFSKAIDWEEVAKRFDAAQ